MDFKRTEQMNLDNLFCCVLVKGKTLQGTHKYIYLGIHLDNLEKMFEVVKATGAFNPKDFQAVVIARADSEEPPQEVRAFMQKQYEFKDDEVVLKIV